MDSNASQDNTLANSSCMTRMNTMIQHAYQDSAQLGGILGTPDKPDLHVLAEALGDAEGVSATKVGEKQVERLPCFERLHEHEDDSRHVAGTD
jgi:hypothetical protein